MFDCFDQHGRGHGFWKGSAMSDGADPTKTLMTAREKLVEERRALAVAIALGYRRRRTDDPQTNEQREAFIEVQALIEAFDRAIVDEKSIEGPLTTSFAASALDAPQQAAE